VSVLTTACKARIAVLPVEMGLPLRAATYMIRCALIQCLHALPAWQTYSLSIDTWVTLRQLQYAALCCCLSCVIVCVSQRVPASTCPCLSQHRPPVLGLKAAPSSSLLGASGFYTFWQDPNALAVGTTRVKPANADTFTSLQDCMSACDDEAM
jgi:hypothetical protein